MRIECPSCKQALSAPEGAEGRRVRCAKCKTTFVIPASTQRPCPRCQEPLDPTAIICHRCGVNLQTGRTPADAAIAEGEQDSQGEPRFRPGHVVTVIEAFLPGLIRPGILIRAVLFALFAVFTFVMCAVFSYFGLLIEAPFIGGLGLIVYAWAIAMLITGERGFPHELLAELSGLQWLLFLALLAGIPFLAYFAVRGCVPQVIAGVAGYFQQQTAAPHHP